MTNYYTTGKFSKLANVTERTIRYYDKIGLLKPSFVMENGYRKYSDKDFLKLQKIVSLKQLGFSIQEIFPLIANDENVNLKDSFLLQSKLIDKRISQFQILNDALKSAASLADKDELDWSKVIELVHLSQVETEIVEHYKNATNLNSRIMLHDKYSVNKKGWFTWLYEQIDFGGVYRLLEVGCGNGKLWKDRNINIRNREIFLSDSSVGIIEEVRKELGKEFNCIVADCESIPFKDSYFDSIIANHVLFYVKDLDKGLTEIQRVLKRDGFFYCSTYGSNHMREISELVNEFDNRIVLSESQLYDKFGLDNGENILKQYFDDVQKLEYPDKLVIDEIQPLIDYILSCHGNQNEVIGKRINEFRVFLNNKMDEKGYIEITKNAGLFKCKKNKT